MARQRSELTAALAGAFPRRAEEEQRWTQEMFGTVRILVVGKSGAGKSALLRLVIGDEGPQTMADGEAGRQDINKEYEHKVNPEMPIIFHDSDGVDGEEGVKSVQDFLEERQTRDDFSEQVHAVWYVVSAIDNRIKSDGKLLRAVSKYTIPLLLVITHTDMLMHRPREINKREQTVHELIDQSVEDPDSRRMMKESIVRVGNDVTFCQADNRMEVHQRDEVGLESISRWMHGVLRTDQMKSTWAASQAVDIIQKLNLSAERIVAMVKISACLSPLSVIPYADCIQIYAMFEKVFWYLCSIWTVPETLKEELSAKLLINERSSSLLQRASEGTRNMVGLASAASSAVPGGITLINLLPKIFGVITSASGVTWGVNAVTASVKAFGMQVLGCILFVKCRQASKYRWDPNLTKDKCEELCLQFVINEAYSHELIEWATANIDAMGALLQASTTQEILCSKMVSTAIEILHDIDRPSSSASVSGFRA